MCRHAIGKRFARVLAASATLLACQAPAFATPLTDFFATHPRFAILPAPYFEPALTPDAYADIHLAANAFVPPGTPWYATLTLGSGENFGRVRFPAEGTTRASGWNAFLPLGDRAINQATLSLVVETPGQLDEVMHLDVPMRATRFSSLYRRGDRAKQCSWRWGEDGGWVVVLQQRYAPDFYRVPTPVTYLGGDFHYERIEDLVRFLRTHGVDALGYKPDYTRPLGLMQMAEADWPNLATYLKLTHAPRTHLVGLCLGGLVARGLAHVAGDRRILSVTTVGTPNRGSEMAEFYNRTPWLQTLDRVLANDMTAHPYQDAQDAVAAFNRALGPSAVPLDSITLDAAGHRLDERYDLVDGPLRLLTAIETGRNPDSVHTDGLILSRGQAIGRSLGVWHTDHAGMINEGRASEYFDAYSAHLRLVTALDQHVPSQPKGDDQ